MQATPTQNAHDSQGIETKRKSPARGVIYTPALFTIICDRIAAGESLRSVCRDAEMPNKSTVMRWLREKPELRDQYAIARDDLIEHWAEDIIEIADDGTLDTIPGTDKYGNEVMVANHANVQRDRVRIEARKWLMSRLSPKKYGDRVDVEHSGEVGHTHRVDITQLSAREKMRRLALFMLEDQAAGQTIDGESTVMTDDGPLPSA